MTKHESFLNEKNGKMTKRSRAYIDYASSHNVDILNSFNTELQLKDTEPAIGNKLIDLLTELKGLKFLTTLVIQFKKKIESDNATKYIPYYSNSKAERTINESDIDGLFEVIYTTIVCFYRITYAFQSESTLYSCLNVKELLTQNRRDI